MLKNESAAVQLHFLSGNVSLAKLSLPQPSEQHTPCLRIAQRMRLEQTQLEGVYRRIQVCVCVCVHVCVCVCMCEGDLYCQIALATGALYVLKAIVI